jgi:hypothetical protein
MTSSTSQTLILRNIYVCFFFLYKEILEKLFTQQRIGKIFGPSTIPEDQYWDRQLLDHLQVEIGKLCFFFRLEFNVLCLKTIHGKEHIRMYSCALRREETDGERLDNSNIFNDKWMQANKRKCLSSIIYMEYAIEGKDALQACLQSDSSLTMLLIVHRNETGENLPFLLPLKSGSSCVITPFNDDIQDRVKAAIESTSRKRVGGAGGGGAGGGGPKEKGTRSNLSK